MSKPNKPINTGENSPLSRDIDPSKLVSNPNVQTKKTLKNSYDTKYQSPSHNERKSVKVFDHTHALAQEIKFETKEKANIYVYEKAIEHYAKHVLGK